MSDLLRPGRLAPDLDLPLVGGGRFRLAERRPERYTMVVFNRGLHCPVCQAQLRELERRRPELSQRGIDVVSVSGETEDRATRMRDDWRVAGVPIAYGLTEEAMRPHHSADDAGMGGGTRGRSPLKGPRRRLAREPAAR